MDRFVLESLNGNGNGHSGKRSEAYNSLSRYATAAK
jgi:hypothetical protein